MTEPRAKSVRIAELKARLSAYVRAVRHGQVVIVCDRDTPVARLVPYATEVAALRSRLPARRWGATPLPPPLGRPVDSLGALLAERESNR